MDTEFAETFKRIQQRPWNSHFFSLPDWHRRYPTMLTQEEMRMLAWLAQNLPIQGDIADLGCFLGGSSISLAWGASQSLARRHVFSYDRFTIDEKLKFQFLYRRGHGFYAGNDIISLFRNLTKDFSKIITPIQGDVRDQAWPGEDLALLFIDISKTKEINDYIVTTFLKLLEPGSIIVQQDFLFFRNPWLYPTMERLKGSIEMLAHTENHSVIFGVHRKPTPAEIESCLSRNVSPTDTLEAISFFRDRFQDLRQIEMIDALEAAVRTSPDADKAWLLKNVSNIPVSFSED